MEKNNDISWRRRKPLIGILGPESTGKSKIASQLSTAFQGILVPEYARAYVVRLNRPYNYRDLTEIMNFQIEERNKWFGRGDNWVFFDTDLILTRNWFIQVYHKCPSQVEDNILKNKLDFYLLCSSDLPWVADPVRENGGEQRIFLFERYKQDLEHYGFPYAIVSGTGELRYQSALEGLSRYFGNNYIKRELKPV